MFKFKRGVDRTAIDKLREIDAEEIAAVKAEAKAKADAQRAKDNRQVNLNKILNTVLDMKQDIEDIKATLDHRESIDVRKWSREFRIKGE